jgi:hypothetical protein
MPTDASAGKAPMVTDDSLEVAEAIETILKTRFAPGREVTNDDSTEVSDARFFAATVCSAGGIEPQLRAFQRAGISSRYVAQALRAGLLVAHVAWEDL